MSIRLCVVGPGRVGAALARRWAERGVEVLGFLGRRPAAVAAALQFCGQGEALQPRDLSRGHVVVFAVGDADLPADITTCAEAAQPLRSCSLWLHTSGRFGLEVLAPLQQHPVRLGALHPVCPFADAASGYAALPGRFAVLRPGDGAARLLQQLAFRLEMRPIQASPSGDPLLYHAACVLAANGLTALFSLCEQVMASSSALPADAARQVLSALMQAALDGAGAHGAAAALSGPVLRGDREGLQAHLAALQQNVPQALPAYRALQHVAVDLAAARGLGLSQQQALRQLLDGGGG